MFEPISWWFYQVPNFTKALETCSTLSAIITSTSSTSVSVPVRQSVIPKSFSSMSSSSLTPSMPARASATCVHRPITTTSVSMESRVNDRETVCRVSTRWICIRCDWTLVLCAQPTWKLGQREWVISFLMAHQHILGYLVPYNGENVIKMWRYNQGYLATINMK